MNLDDYIGLPWTRENDCWWLARKFLKERVGLDLPRLTYDVMDADSCGEAIALEKSNWQKVESPEPYDAIVFLIRGKPWHIGVYLGGGVFLHSPEGGRTSRVERLNTPYWQPRIEGIYRHV